MLEVRVFSKRDKRFRAMLDRCAEIDVNAISTTAEILNQVRNGDESVLFSELTHYGNGGTHPEVHRVSPEECVEARKKVSESFLTAFSLARVNARKFHEHQRRKGYIADDNDGAILSRQVRALHRIGIYCGASFSSLIAHVVPAQIAGVGTIAIAASPGSDGDVDPHILAAAHVLGIDEIYRLQGAHAMAAMAYGTTFMEKVEKIYGSDDNSAGVAKHLLTDVVGVVSGRSGGDLAIVADNSANARFVAGDLLAQAEIGEKGQIAVLLTTDRLFAEAVRIEAERLVHRIPNPDSVKQHLDEFGAIFVCQSLDTAIAAVNTLAPAKLSLHTRHNDACLSEVETAGAVFMGQWSAEAAGGYFSGVNPHLPVSGSARFRSGLGVEDFVREMPVVEFGPDRFLKTGRHQAILAEEEGFTALAETVKERLELLKLTVE